MKKFILGFITGIVFVLLIAFVPNLITFWAVTKGERCEVTNYSPNFIIDKNLYVNSVTYDLNELPHGTIFALNIDTQEEIWRIPTKGTDNNGIERVGKIIYLHNRNIIDAINAETGEQLWSKEFGPNSVLRYKYCGDYIVSDSIDMISIFDRHSGDKLWEFSPKSRVVGNLICSDNKFFYTSHNGELHAMNLNTGEEVWSKYLNEKK